MSSPCLRRTRGTILFKAHYDSASNVLLPVSIRAGRLTWHDGVIPENEIWVKLGGDKGGGSFKMSLQIGNLVHPNSPHNTIVFCAFEAADTSCNLHIGLDRYAEQIACLKDLEWE